MQDENKTKAQLIEELVSLRQQIAEMQSIMELIPLRSFVDNMPDNIYVKDNRGCFLMANAASVAALGATSEEAVIGKTDFDFYPEDLATRYFTDEQAIIQTGQPLINREEPVADRRTGQMEWYLSSKVPLKASNGEVAGIIGISRNITAFINTKEALAKASVELERQHTEAKLIEERNLLRTLIDTVPDSIYVKDHASRFVIANRTVATLMGTTPEELIGRTDFEYYPYETALPFHTDEQMVIQTGEPLINREEFTLHPHQEYPRWILTTKVPYQDTQGNITGIVGVGRDITERKQTEEALRQSEERYRAIVEDQTEFIVRCKADWTRTFVNGAYCRYMGKSREELLGASFLSIIVPEDAQAVLDAVALLSPENPTVTTQYRVTKPDGSLAWQEWADHAIYDSQGQLVEYQSVGRDITERRLIEEQKMELALRQERVQLLEELISDISHDIKTPVASINTYLYLLRRQPDPEKQKHYLNTLEIQVQRLMRLVEDILTMSRLDKGEAMILETVTLESVAGEVGRAYQHLAQEKNIMLIFDMPIDIPAIRASPVDLGRAVGNLLENAIAYTAQGGKVTLRTGQMPGKVFIEVRDTGAGISQEELPRIFDRFYRTDKSRNMDNGGTGLGLAIVKKIVEAHRGQIEVESEVNKGSTFRIYLPA